MTTHYNVYEMGVMSKFSTGQCIKWMTRKCLNVCANLLQRIKQIMAKNNLCTVATVKDYNCVPIMLAGRAQIDAGSSTVGPSCGGRTQCYLL